MKGFDIRAAADEMKVEDEGLVVQVNDKDGEPLFYENAGQRQPVTITVAGTYSERYRKAEARWNEKQMRNRRAKLTADMVDDRRLHLAASCVLTWDGFTAAGEVVPCTYENARVLFATLPYIREQVEEAMTDHAGFSKENSAS